MSNSLDAAVGLVNQGDYQSAIEQLEAISENQRQAEVNYYLGFCHLKLGDRQKGKGEMKMYFLEG